MRKGKRRMLLLLLFAAFFGAGLLAAATSPDIVGEPVQAADQTYVHFSTQLTCRSQYLLCGHVLTQEEAMPAAYIGLSKEALRKELPDTSITRFSAEALVLTKRYRCYCPEHYVVYAEDGELAAYQTVPHTDTAEEAMRLPIGEAELTAAERRALQAGKVFGSQKEVSLYAAALQNRG